VVNRTAQCLLLRLEMFIVSGTASFELVLLILQFFLRSSWYFWRFDATVLPIQSRPWLRLIFLGISQFCWWL